MITQNIIVTLLFCMFVLLIAMLIVMNTKRFRSLDSQMSEKIKEYLSGLQSQDITEAFIPTLHISKTWKVEGEVLGELNLSASGETSKVARENLRFLYNMSNEHDNHCIKASKEHKKVAW